MISIINLNDWLTENIFNRSFPLRRALGFLVKRLALELRTIIKMWSDILTKVFFIFWRFFDIKRTKSWQIDLYFRRAIYHWLLLLRLFSTLNWIFLAKLQSFFHFVELYLLMFRIVVSRLIVGLGYLLFSRLIVIVRITEYILLPRGVQWTFNIL